MESVVAGKLQEVVLPDLGDRLIPQEPALLGVVEGVGGKVGRNKGGGCSDVSHVTEFGFLAFWPHGIQLVRHQLSSCAITLERQDGGQRIQRLVQEVLNEA